MKTRTLLICAACIYCVSCDEDASGPGDVETTDSAVTASDAATGDAGPGTPSRDAAIDAGVEQPGKPPNPSPGPQQPDATQPLPPPLDAAIPADAASASMDAAQAPGLDASPWDGPDTSIVAASGSDAGEGADELRAQLVQKLRECGIVGEGEYNRRPIQDEFDRCETRCNLAADCAALSPTLCTNDLRNPELIACYGQCSNLPFEVGAACGNLKLRKRWICDGAKDCRSGDDERDCVAYQCADGKQLTSPYVRCNGRVDCEDKSDELGCAPYCANRGVRT